jgi:bifunctional DNA-binding transcriptional regulator/antitoxin component of YhaV-PrlF toxin-antitoxin module
MPQGYLAAMQIDIASVTVKGQFTIPRKFCDALKLTAGSKMFIVCDGEHLLLKPLTPPDFKVFAKVVRESKTLAEKARKGATK